MTKRLVFATALFAAMASVSFGATVYSETFEGYADNAALTTAMDSNVGDTLSTEQNHTASGTKSVKSTGGTTAVGGAGPEMQVHDHYAATNGTVAEPFVVEAWVYDGTPTTGDRRGLSVGAYSGGTYGAGTLENLLQMGPYSSVSGGGPKVSTRVVTGGTWVVGTQDRKTGWQKYSISVNNTTAVFKLDDVETGNQTCTTPPTGWSSWRWSSFLTAAGTPGTADLYMDDLTITGPGSSVGEWHLY